jgi:hypothetical protein
MGRGSAACPPDEELAALALGEVRGDARLALADHVVGCRRCAESHRTLLELHAAAGPARARTWIAAASAAAAAAVLALSLSAPPPAPDASGDVRRGAAAAGVEPAPGGTLDRPPSRLRWPPQPGARGYQVRMYDATGDGLWSSTTLDVTLLELDGKATRPLEAGHAYFWTVEVVGRPGARLGPFWFQLADRP